VIHVGDAAFGRSQQGLGGRGAIGPDEASRIHRDIWTERLPDPFGIGAPTYVAGAHEEHARRRDLLEASPCTLISPAMLRPVERITGRVAELAHGPTHHARAASDTQ